MDGFLRIGCWNYKCHLKLFHTAEMDKDGKKYTYLGVTDSFLKRRKVWLKLDDNDGEMAVAPCLSTTGETFGGDTKYARTHL